MESIIKLTDNPDGKSIEISVGLDQATLNLASPAHLTAVWVVNNFQTIVEQAGNDRQKLIAAVAANVEQGRVDAGQDPQQLEDVNGRRLGQDPAQEPGID